MRGHSDPHKFVTTSFNPSLYVNVCGTALCGISNATFPVTCSPGFEFDTVFIALGSVVHTPLASYAVPSLVVSKEKRIAKHLILLVVIRARHVKHHKYVTRLRRCHSAESATDLSHCRLRIDLNSYAPTASTTICILRSARCATTNRYKNKRADKKQRQCIFERRLDVPFHHPNYWIHILPPCFAQAVTLRHKCDAKHWVVEKVRNSLNVIF